MVHSIFVFIMLLTSILCFGVGVAVERFVLSPKADGALCPPKLEAFVPYCVGTISEGGNHYHGGLSYGVKDGVGTYKWADGGRYTGEYRGGWIHGKGTLIWADGSKYEGNWLFGKKALAAILVTGNLMEKF